MSKILLVDYGSYYFKDIIKCMEILGVEYIEFAYYEDINSINKNDISGIILSGGPGRVNNPNDPHFNKEFLTFHIPILGICYGMQILMHYFLGNVEALSERDLGLRNMEILKQSPLNSGINNPSKVWMAHYDHVSKMAPDFDVLARTDISICMIENKTERIYAVQYHPEKNKSKDDLKLLENFIFNICNY